MGAGHPLEQRKRAWPGDLYLAERAHVDDAYALAKGAVLLGERVEVGRLCETERALIGARAAPGLPGLKVVRPLPTMLGAEDRAEVLQARVQRARPPGTAPLVGVEG